MDLIVNIEKVLNPGMIADLCAKRNQSVLICDRCNDDEELVVATMEVLEATFTFCAGCAGELPTGFHVA